MCFRMCLGDFVCFVFQENEIRVLNINGPRESSVPGIHDKSHLVATNRSCSDLQNVDPFWPRNQQHFLQQGSVDKNILIESRMKRVLL